VVDVPEVARVAADGDPPDLDAELLGQVVEGDSEAFGRLYDRHARSIYRFCGRRCGDWTAAEDLSSVVFLEAWRTRHRAFLVELSLRPWLLGIAANVVSTSRRSSRRHRAALQRFASADAAAGRDGDPVAADAARQADLARTGELVRKAIDRLSRPQRQVVELCLLGELSVVAAAEMLALPVSTVRSRLDDSRARLRTLLRSSDLGRPSWLIGHHEGERRIGSAPVVPEGVRVP